MHLGLLITSVILIITGIASGFTPLIILGIFLLLPALTTRRRQTSAPRTERPRSIPTTQTRREQQQPEPVLAETPPSPPPSPPPTTDSGMLPPLFPSQIFPTLRPVQLEVQKENQVSQKDELPEELLQMAVAFLLGRFLSKRRR